MKKKILIVEDNQEWLSYLEEIIKTNFDVDLDLYSNFKKAESKLSSLNNIIDLLITDIFEKGSKIPKGLKFAEFASKHNIPVIVVTIEDEFIRTALKDYKVNDAIYKEKFSTIDFINSINEILNDSSIILSDSNRRLNPNGNEDFELRSQILSILDKIPEWHPINKLKTKTEKLEMRFLSNDPNNIDFIKLHKVDLKKAIQIDHRKISQDETEAIKFINLLENICNY